MSPITLIPRRYIVADKQLLEAAGLTVASSKDSLIEISTNGTDVDLCGAVIDGEGVGGSGIHVHDCEDVTVKNGMIRGFHFGVRAENVARLIIEDCVISDNHNPQGIGWLPDTHEPVEEGFGGGIYLLRTVGSIIKGNQLNNNFDGICIVGSDRNEICSNDASHCGNVGIHLIRSSHNTIAENKADHCVRFTGRFWCDTADSAGILLEEHSHDNRILDNSLRYSGDGFFIRANNRHGCNNNYIARNDGSYSPNNAFEVDFSENNIFENNVADFSNYGFWLGYCRATIVRDNQVFSNRLDGIAVANGDQVTIEGNRIDNNRIGLRLWQEANQGNQKKAARNATSIRSNIFNNEISNSRSGAILYQFPTDAVVKGNNYQNNPFDYRRGPQP